MRKLFLLVCIILNFLLIISSPAFSYTLNGTEVGDVDSIIDSSDLPDSGYATELLWAQTTLAAYTGLNPEDFFFEDDSAIQGSSGFTLVDDQDPDSPDVYALDLLDYIDPGDDFPSFYFIKYGNGGIDGLDSHQMYENLAELQWAVISLNAVSTAQNFDISRVSHVQLIEEGSDIPSTPIPEPGTMFLFGFSLIGIAGFSRRRVKKG